MSSNESSIASKRKLSQIYDKNINEFNNNINNNENNKQIIECINDLIEKIEFKSEPNISQNSINKSIDFNDIEFDPNFWNDFDFEIKFENETIHEIENKFIENEMKTKMVSKIDCNKHFHSKDMKKSSINEKSMKWSNIPLNRTQIGAQVLAELDSIK
jgi:hypothetical protein